MSLKYAPKNTLVILGYIAINNRASRWQISQNTKKSYSNIHKSVKTLLKMELIEVVGVEPSKKNPKLEVEYYTLTRKGLMLMLCLMTEDSAKNVLGVIAENYGNACLIFKKWALFKQKNVEHIVVKRVINSLSFLGFIMISGVPSLQKRDVLKIIFEKVAYVFDIVDASVFGLNLHILLFTSHMDPRKLERELQETQQLLSAINEDDELRNYTSKILKKDRKTLKRLNKAMNELITTVGIKV